MMKATDSVTVIETVVDDLTPMALGYLLERVIELGAKDAYIIPCTMKKSRPGHLVTVLADKKNFKCVVEAIFKETTTTGIRYYSTKRIKLGRISRAVNTRYGTVSVKVNTGNKCMPEFESCREIARKKKIPFVSVYEEAKRRCDGKIFKA